MKMVRLNLKQNYKFGRKHGVHREWFENQQIKVEGKFAGNKKIDKWIYYNSDGAKVKTEIYTNNELVNTIHENKN